MRPLCNVVESTERCRNGLRANDGRETVAMYHDSNSSSSIVVAPVVKICLGVNGHFCLDLEIGLFSVSFFFCFLGYYLFWPVLHHRCLSSTDRPALQVLATRASLHLHISFVYSSIRYLEMLGHLSFPLHQTLRPMTSHHAVADPTKHSKQGGWILARRYEVFLRVLPPHPTVWRADPACLTVWTRREIKEKCCCLEIRHVVIMRSCIMADVYY